jgi:hypothetical protein
MKPILKSMMIGGFMGTVLFEMISYANNQKESGIPKTA